VIERHFYSRRPCFAALRAISGARRPSTQRRLPTRIPLFSVAGRVRPQAARGVGQIASVPIERGRCSEADRLPTVSLVYP